MHKEFEDRHESEMKPVIIFVIVQYVQLLNVSIVKEKIERQKAISEVQRQINILRDEVRTLNSNSNLRPRDARTDEVVIGGFGQKSKDGAIKMIEKIIDGKEVNPTIILAKLSL